MDQRDKEFAKLKRAIRTRGPKNAEQARKMAKAAVRAASPRTISLEERLTHDLEAIPVAENFRGESAAARQRALDTIEEVAKLNKSKPES